MPISRWATRINQGSAFFSCWSNFLAPKALAEAPPWLRCGRCSALGPVAQAGALRGSPVQLGSVGKCVKLRIDNQRSAVDCEGERSRCAKRGALAQTACCCDQSLTAHVLTSCEVDQCLSDLRENVGSCARSSRGDSTIQTIVWCSFVRSNRWHTDLMSNCSVVCDVCPWQLRDILSHSHEWIPLNASRLEFGTVTCIREKQQLHYRSLDSEVCTGLSRPSTEMQLQAAIRYQSTSPLFLFPWLVLTELDWRSCLVVQLNEKLKAAEVRLEWAVKNGLWPFLWPFLWRDSCHGNQV